MVFKLFKSKDKFGVYDFLRDVNTLNEFVNKKRSKLNVVTIEDVQKIINDIKDLHGRSKVIHKNLQESSDIKDKNRDFMLLVLGDKFGELKLLYEKCKEYEKQLLDYEKIGKNQATK